MQITDRLTDTAVRVELGRRLERLRLDRNLAQDRLAEEAGVSRDTVLRLEHGQSVTLTALLRILRALELLDGLEALVPEPLPSPIEQLERAGRTRRRASRARDTTRDEKPDTWRWGTP